MLADHESQYISGIIHADSGSLQNMNINGNLTMGSGGAIQNTEGDFIIHEDGIRFLMAEDAQSKSVAFVKSGIGQIGSLFSNDVTEELVLSTATAGGGTFDIRLAADTDIFVNASNDMFINADADLSISATNENHSGFVKFNGRVQLPHFTDSSRPSSPLLGEMIYNTTINRAEMWNGQAWADMTQ